MGFVGINMKRGYEVYEDLKPKASYKIKWFNALAGICLGLTTAFVAMNSGCERSQDYKTSFSETSLDRREKARELSKRSREMYLKGDDFAIMGDLERANEFYKKARVLSFQAQKNYPTDVEREMEENTREWRENFRQAPGKMKEIKKL